MAPLIFAVITQCEKLSGIKVFLNMPQDSDWELALGTIVLCFSFPSGHLVPLWFSPSPIA